MLDARLLSHDIRGKDATHTAELVALAVVLRIIPPRASCRLIGNGGQLVEGTWVAHVALLQSKGWCVDGLVPVRVRQSRRSQYNMRDQLHVGLVTLLGDLTFLVPFTLHRSDTSATYRRVKDTTQTTAARCSDPPPRLHTSYINARLIELLVLATYTTE